MKARQGNGKTPESVRRDARRRDHASWLGDTIVKAIGGSAEIQALKESAIEDITGIRADRSVPVKGSVRVLRRDETTGREITSTVETTIATSHHATRPMPRKVEIVERGRSTPYPVTHAGYERLCREGIDPRDAIACEPNARIMERDAAAQAKVDAKAYADRRAEFVRGLGATKNARKREIRRLESAIATVETYRAGLQALARFCEALREPMALEWRKRGTMAHAADPRVDAIRKARPRYK